MFWKKKLAPARTKELLQIGMRESLAGLAGLYDADNQRLLFKQCEVDLKQKGVREALLEELKKGFLNLPRNPDNWTPEYGRLDEEIRLAFTREDRIQGAALVILVALMKTSTCCKAALLYPDDVELSAAVFNLVTTNLGVLDHILMESPETFGRSISMELCSEMIYVKQFMDMKIGL